MQDLALDFQDLALDQLSNVSPELLGDGMGGTGKHIQHGSHFVGIEQSVPAPAVGLPRNILYPMHTLKCNNVF